ISMLANVAILAGSTILFALFMVRTHRSIAGPQAMKSGMTTAQAPDIGRPPSTRGKFALLSTSAALLFACGGVYYFVRSMDGQRYCLIIGHRGGTTAAPENTLAAFSRGIADGADWLELDVQENADGEVVVVHDRDLMRLAHSNRQVYQLTGQ